MAWQFAQEGPVSTSPAQTLLNMPLSQLGKDILKPFIQPLY